MPENRNSMLPILLAFGAGIAVGANWPKIKRFIAPYMDTMGEKGSDGYGKVMKFVAEQKERMEDALAEAKVTKKKQGRPKAAKV